MSSILTKNHRYECFRDFIEVISYTPDKNEKWKYKCECGEIVDWKDNKPKEVIDHWDCSDWGPYEVYKKVCPHCGTDLPKMEIKRNMWDFSNVGKIRLLPKLGGNFYIDDQPVTEDVFKEKLRSEGIVKGE